MSGGVNTNISFWDFEGGPSAAEQMRLQRFADDLLRMSHVYSLGRC